MNNYTFKSRWFSCGYLPIKCPQCTDQKDGAPFLDKWTIPVSVEYIIFQRKMEWVWSTLSFSAKWIPFTYVSLRLTVNVAEKEIFLLESNEVELQIACWREIRLGGGGATLSFPSTIFFSLHFFFWSEAFNMEKQKCTSAGSKGFYPEYKFGIKVMK